jgi:hypothetical protein
MGELRVYTTFSFTDTKNLHPQWPTPKLSPIAIKAVGDKKTVEQFVIPPSRAKNVLIWDYDIDGPFDVMGQLNRTGSGVLNLTLEIVKPTAVSPWNPTPDPAWAAFPIPFQMGCATVLPFDSLYREITTNRALMGTVDGSGVPYPAAAANGDVTTGFVRRIYAQNPGTTAITLEKYVVFA